MVNPVNAPPRAKTVANDRTKTVTSTVVALGPLKITQSHRVVGVVYRQPRLASLTTAPIRHTNAVGGLPLASAPAVVSVCQLL